MSFSIDSPSAPARIGAPIAAVSTPALVIDLDAMERNLDAMAAFAQRHGVRLRPHAKTHKSAAIALLQMRRGAVGVCVQKSSEALALADAEHPRWPESPDFYFAVADLYLDWAGRNPDIAMSDLLPIVEGAWKRCLDIGEQPGLDGSVEGCGSFLAAENLAIFYDTLGLADEAHLYSRQAAAFRQAHAA